MPSWVSQRQFNFLEANPDQQTFVREELFSEILPKREESVESNNAILAEQQNWVEAICSGGQLRNTGFNGAVAVEIAGKVLEQIEQHQWLPGSSLGPLMTPDLPRPTTTAVPADLQGAKPHAA